MMQIELGNQLAFLPGETIDVEVSWQLPEPPVLVELRCVWNTSGKGTRDVGVEATIPLEYPNAFENLRVTLTLPGHPYSFSGKLLSIIWALELVALPSEESTRTEIIIGPGAAEVVVSGQNGRQDVGA